MNGMQEMKREGAFQVVQNGAGEIVNLASNAYNLASEIRNRMIGAEPPCPENDCVKSEKMFAGYSGELISAHRSISNLLAATIRDLEALRNEIPPTVSTVEAGGCPQRSASSGGR